MTRRELREHIFKLLFLTDFHPDEEMPQQLELYLGRMKDVAEKDTIYIQEKYNHIREKLPEIDKKLEEISQGWTTGRMAKVDLNLLRLAVYEILFDEDIPTGVAINEAVELGKSFGGEESSRFINGILAKVAE